MNQPLLATGLLVKPTNRKIKRMTVKITASVDGMNGFGQILMVE